MVTARKTFSALMALAIISLLAACGTTPRVSTEVTYCCQTGTEGIGTFRVEFKDTPEFLKPMLRDEASVVLAAKGLEYTEGDAHAILSMRYVDKTLTREEEAELESWERIAPGGGVRFIAQVQLEMRNSVTRELMWSGSMQRVHNVYEGSYMHDAPARTAMRNAFLEIFANYPDPRSDVP